MPRTKKSQQTKTPQDQFVNDTTKQARLLTTDNQYVEVVFYTEPASVRSREPAFQRTFTRVTDEELLKRMVQYEQRIASLESQLRRVK